MTKLVSTTAVLALVSLLQLADSANILALMGCASRSHHLWNEVIYEALVAKGHTLTVLSVDKSDSPHANISYIHMEETYNAINDHYKDYQADWGALGRFFSNVRMLYDYQMVTCKGIVQSKGFQEALKLDEQFDLILFDIGTGSCLLRFAQKYPDAPIVAVSAFKLTPEILSTVGGHSYPGYVPLYLNQLDQSMSFWERIYNTGSYILAHFYRKYISEAIIDSMVSKHFPSPQPSLQDLYDRIQIVLVNSHPATDYAQSIPPNVIEIGGIHIKEPKPLPADIEEFMQGAERGVALIALGTNVKAEMLGEERLEMFVKVIERLPKFHFLWKIEKEGLLKEVPKNLLIRKWFPQNDILGHPKLKAFLTHAGGLSTQEATWYGVPVVAMPFFLDQLHHAHQIESRGVGRRINFETLTEKSLFQGLNGVLTDGTYGSNMEEQQKHFRDRENPPLDTAVWWIEYVLRHPRVKHLTPASRHLSYFTVNSLDVMLLAVVVVAMFLVNLWFVLRNIQRTASKTKKTEKSKVKTSSSKKKIKKP